MEKTISNNQPDTQNENIVVWLDFDAYAYINFAIISALSKLGKFNFIGIVTTQQDINFFQNQQIIPFKKLLYYPECYAGKSSFNLDNLNALEKKYDLNIWLDVYAERSFYKYWTDFHKFTKDEILSITENSITFFIDILETYKPKLVFMQQAGENISNLLLYRIAKKMGITTLMPNLLHMQNKILISNNLLSSEICDEFKKILPDFNNSEQIYDEEFIKKHDHTESLKTVLRNENYEISNFYKKINHYIKKLSHNPEPIYKNIGKTRLKMIKHRYQTHFTVKKRKQFLDTNSIKSIEDEKFLYFPLASEPEARILTTSPFYTNQITLAENIARAIPVDLVLYVKEHPVQKIKLWRPIEDYKTIVDLPNVKLVHPSVNNQDLISKSQGVISISGATGFEALFYKKPVILFADEHYDMLSMVTKIKTLTRLHDDIDNALSNFKFNNNELNILMQTIDQQSLSVPYHSIMKDGNVLSSIQRYENDSNLTIQHFLQFYKKYENYFELIAQTVYSKL